MAGRPTKLDADTSERICQAIRGGNYIETAAAIAGIHRDTLYSWLKRGRTEEEGIHRDFVEEIDQALALAEKNALQTIEKASVDHWQAAAWRLERRFPERWGRKRLEITFPKSFDPSKLSDDELQQVKLLLQKAQPEA
jgi:transposase